MPQSTPSCLSLATTRSCFKVGGRQHASSRRIVTCIFRLQHRREQQINALVLWHASRLDKLNPSCFGGECLWTDTDRSGAAPCARAGRRFTGFEEPLNTLSELAVRTRCQY